MNGGGKAARGSDSRRALLLGLLVLGIVALSSAGIVGYNLYKAALDQHRQRLVETVESWALLIEAVAGLDEQHSAFDDPGGSTGATLRQVREAYSKFEGFGQTGEFTLARRNGEQIEFVLSHRESGPADRESVPWASQLAEPMRRALRGETGTVVGLDYRGAVVMAAYHPLPELNMGLVGKIDLAEVRVPFIRTGLAAVAPVSLLLLVGAFVFVRLGRPLARNLARLAAGIDQVSESVLITDADGTIQYVNPAFEKITGYSTAEAVGRTPRILKSGEQSESFYEDFWQTISSGKRWSGRITNRRKDGPLYKATMTVSPMVDDAGHVTNFVAIMGDVTQELALEEQFRCAQKMEAVGQLAGGVAHDFNNLLTGISGYVQLSMMDSDLDGELEADLNNVLSLVGKARDLTSRLLLFSSHAPIERKVMDLDTLVDESSKMLTRMIGEDIEVEVSTGTGDCCIDADPGQIEQVLMNLVVNARDAMASGGHLSIRTTEERLAAPDAAKLGVPPGSYATLTVADDGHGMDAATLDRIFEPFFTTKARGKGTGLGLATAYGIVKEHGGAIGVDSRPGEGSTFKVYLPRVAEEVVAEAKLEPTEISLGAGETILVVEDEKAVLEVLRRQLSQRGYRVLAASGPEQAERIYARQGDDVALLLTDVVMPGCNGITLCKRLAERCPDLKVVFMSGYSDKVEGLAELMDGDATFVRKPFQLEELMREIRAALDR